MAKPGKIYWLASAKQWRQEGRRGSISRDQAARTVSYSEKAGRFRDQRGRFIPNNTFDPPAKTLIHYTARDQKGQPFLSTLAREERIAEDLARQLLSSREIRSNQQVVISDVWHDGKGNVYRTSTSSVLGGKTNLASLEDVADKRIRGQAWEKAGIPSGLFKKSYHLSRHYSLKTIEKPQLARAA